MSDEGPHPHKLQKAMDFIRHGIAGNRYPTGSTLPPMRHLSTLAGVSYVTVWKAVSILSREGVVSAAPGQLVKVAAESADGATAGRAKSDGRLFSPGQGWRRLRDQIERMRVKFSAYATYWLLDSVASLVLFAAR